MRVRVLFFGMLKDVAGKASDEVDLAEGATVRALLAHYESRIPQLKESLPVLALAVNQEYARVDTTLKAGDEVALLPPVSGGSADLAGEAPTGHLAGQRRYVQIVREPIHTERILAGIKRGEDGAALVF